MPTANVAKFLLIVGTLISAVEFLSPTADADDRVRLSARLDGVKARARYEERSARGRYKFNFRLENGLPGSVGKVTASTASGSAVVGTFTVDSLGIGNIDIDTSEGDAVPDLDVGSVITLLINGNSFSGKLQPR